MTSEQYKELVIRLDKIKNFLKIEEKRMHLKEEELKSQDPSFWEDPKKAEQQMKVIRGLKYWVENFDNQKSAVDDLEVLQEFVKEGVSSDTELEVSYRNPVESIEEL